MLPILPRGSPLCRLEPTTRISLFPAIHLQPARYTSRLHKIAKKVKIYDPAPMYTPDGKRIFRPFRTLKRLTKELNILANKKKVDEALKAKQKIIDMGLKPDAYVYNSLMKMFLRLNQHEKAQEIFAEMKKDNVEPTVHSYTLLIQALGARQDFDALRNAWSEAVGRDLPLDKRIYTSYIFACGSAGQIEEATRALEELRARKKLDKFAGTAYVAALCNAGERERAVQYFRDMLTKVRRPPRAAYLALIDAHMRSGDPRDVDVALALVQEMRARELSLSRDIYHALISGFALHKQPEKAQEWFGQLKQSGWAVTPDSYHRLISAYLSTGQLDHANWTFEEMHMEAHLKPSLNSFADLMAANAQNGFHERVVELHELMTTFGLVAPPELHRLAQESRVKLGGGPKEQAPTSTQKEQNKKSTDAKTT